jgi:hypothetical protein
MGKTILFFNLADMHEHGLAKTSTQSLRRKYPGYSWIYECLHGANRVIQVDLFGMLKGDSSLKSGIAPIAPNLLGGHAMMLPAVQRERLAISMLCGKVDKIMLGIHGRYDDTEQGFAGLGWDQGSGVIGKCSEFADLIAGFLLPSKSYKLALIVCFGARSENFRVNHDGELEEEDIKSSFAYKFYARICDKANITMTARTGSVAFDSDTGRSIVQTEAAVDAEIDGAQLQAETQTHRIVRDYEQLEKFMTKDDEGAQKFDDMVERMYEPNAVPRNPPERIIRAYRLLRNRVNDLASTAANLVPKYGKFVYTYSAGEITVYRKYENGKKTMRVLYQGAV